jgi:DNA-binding protein H-NS
MESNAFKSVSTDELWNFYKELTSTLADKLVAEKATLDERLRQIATTSNVFSKLDRVRRPYPKVLPKYQNPKNLAETWSGRGKRPRWLAAQLRSGKKLESFLIAEPSRERRRQTG